MLFCKNMKNIINIALSFSEKQTAMMSPVVNNVCVYPLKLASVGNFTKLNSWALEYHSKDAGCIELQNDLGNWRKRQANSLHIYAPECYYREDTREVNFPLEENYFIFTDGERCGFEYLLDPDLLFATLNDPEGKVGNLMRKAGELCALNGERAFWKVQALFIEIIQLLMSARKTESGSWNIDNIDEISFADEVEIYLRKNIAENVKTSDIARYMKVSESSLNHKFKNDTGVSPIARLIEIRMDFAKSLLLKGEKLTTIADMTGFCDEYHLSKTFKKQSGLSPRAFKNKQK